MPPNDQEPACRLVDPSTGNIVGSFYENGSGDVEIQPSDGTQYKFAQSPSDNVDVARLQDVFDNSIEVFNSDGTFDSTNIDFAIVEVVGGGGGGGYRPTPSGSYTDMPASGGGGGGGYAKSIIDLSTTNSVSITVGAGGDGGTSSAIDGDAGGNSSFGSSVTASGGSGGSGAVENDTAATGGQGGSSSGDISVNGGNGEAGYTTGSVVVSGNGAGTKLSAVNVLEPNVADSNPSSVSQSNAGYGSGGAGNIKNDFAFPGGDGFVIVRY